MDTQSVVEFARTVDLVLEHILEGRPVSRAFIEQIKEQAHGLEEFLTQHERN
jgi:hypothetical protein